MSSKSKYKSKSESRRSAMITLVLFHISSGYENPPFWKFHLLALLEGSKRKPGKLSTFVGKGEGRSSKVDKHFFVISFMIYFFLRDHVVLDPCSKVLFVQSRTICNTQRCKYKCLKCQCPFLARHHPKWAWQQGATAATGCIERDCSSWRKGRQAHLLWLVFTFPFR